MDIVPQTPKKTSYTKERPLSFTYRGCNVNLFGVFARRYCYTSSVYFNGQPHSRGNFDSYELAVVDAKAYIDGLTLNRHGEVL